MTIKEILDKQIAFDSQLEGRRPFFESISDDNIEVLEHLIVCLVGEVGEFANIVKKVSRGDFLLSMRHADLSEEIADIFIYTIKIAAQLGIDLEAAFIKKMEMNRDKLKRFKK